MLLKQWEGSSELLRGRSKNINFQETHECLSFKAGESRRKLQRVDVEDRIN